MGQVDYAALAAQARKPATTAPVDYAALAAKARTATAVPAPLPAQKTQPDRAALDRVMRPRGSEYGAPSDDIRGGVRAMAAQTVYGGGDLIRRGWNAVVPASMDTDRIIDTPQAQARMTAPDSMAGALGYGAAQIASLVLPLARVGTAMKAAPLAARMGAESATAGTITAAQGGDPVTAAVTGAAGPVVSRVAQAAPVQSVVTALREGAEKRIAQALGATKERFKSMAEKLAPEMLGRGVPGRAGASREGLLEQARAQASAYGRSIDDALEGAKDEVVSTGLITDALESAKSAFQTTRRMTVQEAARQGLQKQARDAGNGMVDVVVTIDARPIEQLAKLQETIAQLGDDATVGQIVAIRRVWDDVVARAGGFAHRSGPAFGVPLAEQTEAWAKREATTAIRRVLSESQPDLAVLNKEYAFWSNLRGVLTATQRRTQAQSSGLTRTILGGAGATAGALTGDTPSDRVQNAVMGGLVGRQLIAAVTSPRWRFVSADIRNRVADALASGKQGDVLGALVRASTALSGGPMRPVPAH